MRTEYAQPMSREQVNSMFQRFDKERSGHLDRKSFLSIMKVLFSNLLMRVAVQYILTLVVVPLMARRVLDMITLDSEYFWEVWTKPKELRGMEELSLEDYIDWRVTDVPSSLRTIITKMAFGSEDFWRTVPLAFTTIILGLVLVPWVLNYIDDFVHFGVEFLEKRKVKKTKTD